MGKVATETHQQSPCLKSVDDITHRTAAPMLPQHAAINTTAPNVDAGDTLAMSVTERKKQNSLPPKYLHHNWWRDHVFSVTTAEWSENAVPLPRPPINELNNFNNLKTIRDHFSLFQIVTPIHVARFQQLLAHHPNQPFVKSVCDGLLDGFWPWADTLKDGYPITHDASNPLPLRDREAEFLKEQVAHEVSKRHFSPPFVGALLPGMYSMPIHAVPKTNRSSDLRMVTDHSASAFSLNSMIPRTKIMAYPLDNLKHLGEVLLETRRTLGDEVPLILFKSDVSEAYRLLPMHISWQIKQVNTIGNLRYVDRCNAFGGRGSGSIWIAFNSLVTWIARYEKDIHDLLVYADDSFKVVEESSLVFYEPFNQHIPADQAKLLHLWDELGIPFKQKKQISGSPLTIIGIEVNPNTMTFTLPPQARLDLLHEIEEFCTIPMQGRGNKHTLREWQRLAGWVNWSFNVFPLLRPCLNNFYPKIAGKDAPNAQIWVNHSIREDLLWAASHIRIDHGVLLLRHTGWSPTDADIVVYCDACMNGMGFWYPDRDLAFYSPVPLGVPVAFIFYYEALCVLSALQYAASLFNTPARIAIYTDNSNTVDIFSSLRCLPAYNPILKAACSLLIATDHQLRVFHVPGDQNEIADAISRQLFADAIVMRPQLTINYFQPPQLPLGAAKK